jgi:hypothetical protein
MNRKMLHALVTMFKVRYLWIVVVAKGRVLRPTSNNFTLFAKEKINDRRLKIKVTLNVNFF